MVNDFLSKIQKQLTENEYIKSTVEKRISAYQYKFYNDETKPFIVLRPIEAVKNNLSGNNTALRRSQKIQIDVQSSNRLECKALMNEIEKELKKINIQVLDNSDSLDEYLEEVERFVYAKRFIAYSELNELNY